MNPALEHAIAARGLRLTRQRRAVIDIVAEAREPVSALQLFATVREANPEIGLTTVYRTLSLLEEIGAVRRLHGGETCEMLVFAGHAHGHSVVCEGCGLVEEFTACEIAPIAEAAAAQTGFAITDHFLQLSGTCRDCRAAQAEARPPKTRP